MLIIIQCAILLKLVSNELVLCLFILLLQYYDVILFQISGNVPVSMKTMDRVLTTGLLHKIIQVDFIIMPMCFVNVKGINDFCYKFLIETK